MAAMDVASSTPLKSAAATKVRVIVRVRPFLFHEKADQMPCVSLLSRGSDSGDEISVYLKDQETSRNECYRLDSFFGQDGHNVGRIFEREVRPLIPGIFHGCNATIFAYGATGSGKTYTMQGTDDELGLMPLAMREILLMCEKTGSRARISYYEVYLDKCYDLLELKPKEIPVREDKDHQIHLNGLCRAPVNSMTEFHDVFSCGVQRRKTAHTGLNDVSSRSHGVLVIYVSTPCGDVILGKLSLIDLAGNEDNRRTCNEGIRLQESAKINQSLFALSNVIFALNNNKPRVPYRDSKLTRILQDSLGGKSRALMIACLNPEEYQQSVHTVSLAARSRNISNFVPTAHKQETPKVKVDMEAKLRAWLESKGKSKSNKRIGSDNSPFPWKNSNSDSSIKRLNFNTSSVKAKVYTYRAACNTKQGTLSVPFKNLDDSEDVQDYWSKTLKEENLRGNSVPVVGVETLDLNLDSKDEREESKEEADDKLIKESNNAEWLGERSNWDESFSTNVARSSPISEIKKTFESGPLRKVFLPIDTNISPKLGKELSYSFNGIRSCSLFFEPKTPKTPSVPVNTTEASQNEATPLDKFNARSCNLKNYLVQEYINFLNTASREELLELKGIGVKIAEYILELREMSPVKSLSDLEKIGLSTKQVHNLFNRTARVIFGKEGE